MSHELVSGQYPEPNGVREHNIGMPSHVNFREIALNAVSGGIFAEHSEAIARNRRIRYKLGKFPTSLLETPYGNGPAVIERNEQDVPEEVTYAVRRNMVQSTRLLLPTNQLMLYFHQRFTSGDVFQSPSVSTLVEEFRAQNASLASLVPFRDSELSFRTEGVDRRSFDRTLFTREEQVAGLELTMAHPETVLTILTYQAVIQDYFQRLRSEFEGLAVDPRSGVNATGLELYNQYTEQWTSSNFTDELIPAMALIALQKPNLSNDQVINQDLFQKAITFLVDNGAFRNWVIVPAEISRDHKERVNHFLCPAVGAIREQLMDGALLNRIYGVINQESSQKDLGVSAALESIRSQAAMKYKKKDEKPFTRERMEAIFEERKNVTLGIQGTEYRIKIDDSMSKIMEGKENKGDLGVHAFPGDLFYDVMKDAMEKSVVENNAVYFNFNGTGYRITPDKVKSVLPKQA